MVVYIDIISAGVVYRPCPADKIIICYKNWPVKLPLHHIEHTDSGIKRFAEFPVHWTMWMRTFWMSQIPLSKCWVVCADFEFVPAKWQVKDSKVVTVGCWGCNVLPTYTKFDYANAFPHTNARRI